jgi:hypothetical protein
MSKSSLEFDDENIYQIQGAYQGEAARLSI